MRQKGYKPKTITKQINSAVKTPRTHLLQYKEKKISTRVPLVVTYNPALEEIRKIIKDLHPILTEDETLKNIFPETLILAFRQPPNLQQKLINRKLPTDGKNEENRTSQCKKTSLQTVSTYAQTTQPHTTIKPTALKVHTPAHPAIWYT
ncbi:Hypothetical predicted protein [Pelobates cultripes]|uniref:Uncharacterized protein n=1 Tax=Pelobates cultripes TaxID=61616 RepID=A0AAD1S0J1_PELCU|nr:Hypothetical predicted protein [Pelobates cultripes]